MYSYLEKIDKGIYNAVTIESKKNFDCIVYSRDFLRCKRWLAKQNKEIIELPFISAFGIKLKLKEVINLAKCKVVSYIAKDSKVLAQAFVAGKVLKTSAFYTRGIVGKGSTIAIIDTGVYPHLDLVVPYNRIVKFVDLINNKQKPYDDNGHGTMVTSLACGNGLVYNGKYKGVSPQSKVVVIKAIEQSGETASIKILEAMQWVYNNRHKYNISVVCMSFGSSPSNDFDPLSMGADSLWRAGLVVVAAAGNSGPQKNTIKSPGVCSRIITVGGIDDKRKNDLYDNRLFTLADFSSRGPAGNILKPDLVAPAVDIIGASNKGGYCAMSGTSVATPLIAGVAALITSKYPKITPDQLKVRLVKSCQKITDNPNEDGYGLLDCERLFVN